MKKSIVILLLALCSSLQAQNPTYQQKLFWTCKVWGFVKYYHSNVSICGVNWDSVLIADLPLVKSAVTKNDFNNALDTMLKAAGPMALTLTRRPDTMAPELKRNLNFAWINDSTFLRHDIITILDTINNNFRPHTECWVQNNMHTNSNLSWLIFPHDSLMLNQNFTTNFPDEWHRMLVLFKYWNIINYLSFNIYVHNIPWDSTLINNVMGVDNATNDYTFDEAFWKFISNLDDSHAPVNSFDEDSPFPMNGYYSIPIVLKYIPNNYVVAKSNSPGISAGDIITSIGGMTPAQWEDSLEPYTTTSDTSYTRKLIAEYMGTGDYYSPLVVGYKDSLNNSHTLTLDCDSIEYYLNSDYYPNDTLATAHYKHWNNCNITYVNVGQIQTIDETPLLTDIENSNSVIFDVRNYPSSHAIWDIIDYILPNQVSIANAALPDVTYPGTWIWQPQDYGFNSNPNGYYGNVIILMDEVTISQAEYVCQSLHTMPHAITVGSQTAGADGNVSYCFLGQNIASGFTTMGWFLGNGDSTQRIGIKPDTLIYPTQAGLRHGRDELLEKALQIASCQLAVPTINESKPVVDVYPNPSSTQVTFKISSGENTYLKILDVTGREIETLPVLNNEIQVNISAFSTGIYFYEIIDKLNNVVDRGKFSVVK